MTLRKRDVDAPDIIFHGCGEVLKELRGKKSFRDLADLIASQPETANVNFTTLSRYEKNQRGVPYTVIATLAKIYDIDQIELLFKFLAKLEEKKIFEKSEAWQNFSRLSKDGTWSQFIMSGIKGIGTNHENER